MPTDVLLVSVWTEPVYVNPGYQLIRDEIARCSRVLVAERLASLVAAHPERAAEYGDVVRYQEQFPYCPGLLSIAAVLERAGLSVRCVSLDVERERRGYAEGWLDAVVAELCDDATLAVGVSAVTPEYARAIEFLGRVKRRAPHLKTMIGGTHVTYMDADAAAEPSVDAVVRGEGELTALELVRRWRAGLGVDDVVGATVRTAEGVRRNPARPLLDLTCLPAPAYHLLDARTLRRVHLTPMYTRGCPHSCNYCVESIFFERRVRHKDPVRFVDELEEIIVRSNWRFIHIADSTFGIDRAATHALCDELERRRLDAVFSINVRPDVFHYMGEALVRRLVALNFVEFYIGMETADERLLANLKRRQSQTVLLDALHRLKALGVAFVKLYLIVGAPGDTHEGLQTTVNTIRLLHEQELIYYATAKYFVPTPGTEQFENPQRNEFEFLTTDWREYERYNFPPVVEHAHLTAYEIEQYLSLLQAIQLAYFRKRVRTDPRDARDRMKQWARETYYRKIYL